MTIWKLRLLPHLRASVSTLINYIRQPVQEIRNLPDWQWPELIVTQIAITAPCGILSGIVSRSPFSIFTGAFTLPILTLIYTAAFCLFFYFTFQIFARKTVSFRQLYTLIFFANIPFYVFQIFQSVLPPMTLIGLAFTAFIMSVGFVENFKLEKKMVLRLIGTLYFLFFLVWGIAKYDSIKSEKSFREEMREAPEVHLGK